LRRKIRIEQQTAAASVIAGCQRLFGSRSECFRQRNQLLRQLPLGQIRRTVTLFAQSDEIIIDRLSRAVALAVNALHLTLQRKKRSFRQLLREHLPRPVDKVMRLVHKQRCPLLHLRILTLK